MSDDDEALSVRPAAAEDAPAVRALLAELGRPAATPETLPRIDELYRRHVEAADTASLVALRGATVVGFVSLHIRERLSQPRPEAWIPDLIVTADEQGRGAAQMLLARAIDEARRRGCHRLVLESHYHRQRAHRFYLREGLADAGKCFVLKLD